ncbi:MAG TPA: WD40 repeat domain-containing protein [Aggregatilinea sp.]|uniref:WD40 repeat domain-containing protein n=1 Tax=Aggregatilinea sp. TaxID=2806333 RepID=UPI002CDE4A12|nr:WD40 repeat domain-containing protein [Aggregatilinea sp.]HML24877.1 WD40 repeat domain-containing protein [Aggregatilinea sp.]
MRCKGAGLRPLFICSLAVCLGAAGLLGGGYAAAQTDDPAPYLYYFSDMLHAYVVERADGSDSRVLGAGLMPEEHIMTHWGGWSPSGEWFAWASSEWAGPGHVPSMVWLVRADGTQGTRLFADAYDFSRLVWSPVDDVLLVGTFDQEMHGRTFLYDVESGQRLGEAPSLEPFEGAGWLPDGSAAYVYHPEWVDIVLKNRRSYMRLIARDGRITEHDVGTFATGMSSAGWFVHDVLGGSQWVAENAVTGESFTFAPPEDISSPGWRQYWNARGDTLLFSSMLDRDTWLLSMVDRSLLDIGPDISWSSDGFTGAPRWSSSADAAVFITHADDEAAPYFLRMLDGATGQVQTLLQREGEFSVKWAGESQSVLVYPGWQVHEPALMLDVETGGQTVLPVETYGLRTAQPSPDARKLAYGEGRSASIPAIYDLDTGQIITTIPYSGGAGGAIYGASWDRTGMWLITSEDMTFSGGGGSPPGHVVLKADGSARRELGRTSFSATAIDWLPDHVLPHLAPGSAAPVIPAPLFTLVPATQPGDTANGVLWYPDGSGVVSNGYHHRDGAAAGSLVFWDLSQPEPRQDMTVPTNVCTSSLACNMIWLSADQFMMWPSTGPTAARVDVRNGDVAGNLSLFDAAGIDAMQLDARYAVPSPNGDYVLVQKSGRGFEILDASGALLHTLPDRDDSAVTWSPDGRTVALGNGGPLALWDVETGDVRLLEPTDAWSWPVWQLAFSPDGRYLAAGSYYQRTAIWDTVTGQQVWELNWYAKALAFSPDGTQLAAAGSYAVAVFDVSDLGGVVK